MADAKKDEIKEPTVDGFSVSGRRKKDVSDIVSLLSPLRFLQMTPMGDTLELIHVESRDISKNPYLFSLVHLKPDGIEILYTISPGMSPSKRRVSILRYFINLVSLLENTYETDHVVLLQIIESSLKDLTEYVSATYDDLYAAYDSLKTEHEQMRKKLAGLQSSNDVMGIENMELKSTNDSLVLKVRELEAFSDEVLMLKIQEWLTDHNNEINVGEFARVHKVGEQRVEAVLNKMIQNGMLKARE
ncbi:MAG: hypothetical protein Q7T16_06495 [Candidatus Burarchaeum sp.]|nr:hypothetical protein [Candidatus Burarchaeum sp.]MDO8340278.1 hypothetical protein [Candidatus Burarchaeum sp.]